MTKKSIKETAAGGSTGGGAIAVSAGRLGTTRKRDSLKDFLLKWQNGVKNKMVMKPVIMGSPIKEFYDLSDVVSRLKGIEGMDQQKNDVVTYGVEDDEGNVMKVSVRKDQAKDFEYRLARDMSDAKDDKMSGAKKNLSLAELLYNLKDEFNIVDVEFPSIPKDVVYNADKATYGPDTSEVGENDVVDDFGDDESMNLEGDMEGESDFGGEGLDDGEEFSDEEMDIEDEDGEDVELDDESVEEFSEEEASATPESILQSVMDMLKADAEAKKAQADAAAEEARAKQAEFAYKSSQATVSAQEEFARMELEMDQQKQKEKEAKKLADLAKHRVQKTSMMRESTVPSILEQIILELDDFDTVQSVNRSKIALRQKYKVLPTDAPEVAQYKQQMLQQSMRELDTRLRAVKIRDRFNVEKTNKDAQEATSTNNSTQRQMQQTGRM